MKLEFDIPEFEEKFKIEITLYKDGRVVTNPPTPTAKEPKETTKAPKKASSKQTSSLIGEGNMMNIDEL